MCVFAHIGCVYAGVVCVRWYKSVVVYVLRSIGTVCFCVCKLCTQNNNAHPLLYSIHHPSYGCCVHHPTPVPPFCTPPPSPPAIHANMLNSFVTVNTSPRSNTDNPNVNKLDVEDRMVLLVTLVAERLRLNVNCAANHNGATYVCDVQGEMQGCNVCVCVCKVGVVLCSEHVQ